MRLLAEKFDAGSHQHMDESKNASLQPELPTSLPDPLAPAKTPATARAQRLATALRDNLRRRKAAGRSTKSAPSRN
jgi:hypothetical protein